MRIQIASHLPKTGDLVRFLSKGAPMPAEVPSAEFDGGRFSTVLLRRGKSRILCGGLGDKKEITQDVFRKASGIAVRALRKIGASQITLDLDHQEHYAQPAVEGAIRASYRYEDFLPAKSRRKVSLKTISILGSAKRHPNLSSEIRTGEKIASAITRTRDLGNQPPNLVNPAALAATINDQSSHYGYRCTVWDEKALARDGFNAILAVGSGSENESRFITLEPRQKIASAPTIAIVGKAVSFDSGGLSIKPASSMEDMKFDKMGGCAAWGIAMAVAELKIPVNLHVAIPSVENSVGQRAYRPGDLIRTWNGQTIEILNTDAEGRVILADALAYACKTWKPDLLIDLATLTGACMVALGEQRAGLFCKDDALADALFKSGQSSGDLLWRLPFGEEFAESVKSDVALAKNSTGSRYGGASTAASFLSHWVTAPKWAHLDIAGPAHILSAKPWMEAGATGFGVGVVVDYLRSIS